MNAVAAAVAPTQPPSRIVSHSTTRMPATSSAEAQVMGPVLRVATHSARCSESQTLRAGIKTVVIPDENMKDLAEIGDEIKSHLTIVPASRMDDVLKVALQRMPIPIQIEEEAPPVTPDVKGEERITAH